MSTELDEQLRQQLAVFALESFRPGQAEVMRAVLEGRDCLCIMPTGGGKSLCYQLPALLCDGVTIVVSPLIALMKDQVDTLQARGVRATLINSTLEMAEQYQRITQMAAGAYQLVYVAPERLRSAAFMEALQQTPVRLLAVDEAHGISQWGHDFRPDYARLGEFRRHLRNPPTIALTATATPTVRDDVAKLLELKDPEVLVTGFARPNLYFESRGGSESWKEAELAQFLTVTHGAGIIYAATRRACNDIAERLLAWIGGKVGVYHAGMRLEDRRAVQESFMAGETPIIVATNAFGMGINKADLRFVVHYQIPGSLEAYYQEAGRAGRDGLPSRCLLLYSPKDRDIQEFFIENNYPSRATVARVYHHLCELDEDPIELSQKELKERLSLDVGGEGVGACELLLERCGAIERLAKQDHRTPFRGRALRVIDRDRPFESLPIDFALLERRKANDYEKLDRMVAFAETAACRQFTILDYFGDPQARVCGICDNCGGVAPGTALPDCHGQSTATAAADLVRCVRMALSGVARTKGRAGISLIAKMLCGSQAQAVHRLGLDRLSTFGLFAHLRQSEAQDFLRVLLAGKLLEQVGGMSLRPMLRLTSLGKQVMAGEPAMEVRLPIGPVLRRKLLATPPPRARQVERQPARAVTSMADRDASSYVPQEDYYWTWRVCQAGFSASECAAIRQLELDTVEEHLRKAREAGKS
jgi:RecQ family ATP-dependent DNA helicase